MDSCISKLLEKMTQAAHENAPVDMSLLLHLFAFDCLGEINTSKQFGFLDSGQDVNNMMAIANQRLEEIAMVSHHPSYAGIQTPTNDYTQMTGDSISSTTEAVYSKTLGSRR